MKRLLIPLIIILTTSAAVAQEAEFTADRPGASTGPSVVGHRVVQLEQGMSLNCDDYEASFTFSNTLIRYGLFDGMELRLAGDGILYSSYDNGTCTPDIKASFSGLSVGTKIRCFEGRGAIPAISLLADIVIPHTGGRDFATDYPVPSLYLLFENPVTDWLSIGYNVGAEWDDARPMAEAFVALCLGFAPTERFGCFVESYNNLSRNGNRYFVDVGINYMLSERLQLDAAVDIDVCDPARTFAISLGVAWQINNPRARARNN